MSIQVLPNEITENILFFLDLQDLARTREVNRGWCERANCVRSKLLPEEGFSSGKTDSTNTRLIKSEDELIQKIQKFVSQIRPYQKGEFTCNFPLDLSGQSDRGRIFLNFEHKSFGEGLLNDPTKQVSVKEFFIFTKPLCGTRSIYVSGEARGGAYGGFTYRLFNPDSIFDTGCIISFPSSETNKVDTLKKKVQEIFETRKKEIGLELRSRRVAAVCFAVLAVVVAASLITDLVFEPLLSKHRDL